MASIWNKQLAPVMRGDIISAEEMTNATPGLCCVTG